MDTHLHRLGAFVAGLSYEAIPAHVARAARYQLLDMIAASHAAARSTETHAVRDGLAAHATRGGRSTVVATGDRYGPCEAALANAAYSMAQDFDDIVWMGHTCHSAVFAPLAVAEHEGAGTRELLTAIVAANEVGGRLGASSFLGPLNGQMWTFIHLVGAAAATSKLLGLDGERTTHALAISLAQPNFPLQSSFMTTSSKLLAASTPTATGIQAAYFARAGMTGDPGVLEDRRGFWKRFSFMPLPVMLGGLGDFWTLATFTLKTYPGCHYFQTALTAIERIRGRRPLTLATVKTVRVESTKLGCEVTRFASEYVGKKGELTPVSVSFDLVHAAAILLHAGRLTVAECEASYLREHAGAIEEWARRIELVHDPALTGRVIASARRIAAGRQALTGTQLRELPRLLARYRSEYASQLLTWEDLASTIRRLAGSSARRRRVRSGRPRGPGVPLAFPSRVTVELADGSREVELVELPTGSLAGPDVERELEVKFLREVGASLGNGKARAALAMGLDLERVTLPEFVRASSRTMD